MDEPKIFYKYKGISNKKSYKYLLDSIKKKYFYFSRPCELNDPFDCFIPKNYAYESEEQLQRFVELSNKKKDRPFNVTKEYVKQRIKDKKYEEFDYQVLNHSHILSLSDSWNNESLWGKYSDTYNGICLGYSSYQENGEYYINVKGKIADLFYDVKNNHIPDFIEITKVDYDNVGDHKFNIFNMDLQVLIYNIFHKKQCWSNENEYRVFCHDNERKYVKDKKGLLNKIEYPENILKEVMFGYNMKKSKMKKIYETIRKNYSNISEISFYIVKPDFTNYKLIRTEYIPT